MHHSPALGAIALMTVVGTEGMALEFADHPCGTGKGTPFSASHVTVLTDDVVAYASAEDEFIILDCDKHGGVVSLDPEPGTEKYETWKFEPVLQERRKLTRDAVCGGSDFSLEELAASFRRSGFRAKVLPADRSNPRPFSCVCDVQRRGGHGAMAGVLSYNSYSILPKDEEGCK